MLNNNFIDMMSLILSVIAVTVSAYLTLYVNKSQLMIQKQQKNISLYKERYEKIYLACLLQFDKLQSTYATENVNYDEAEKDAKEFFEKLDYGRFLVKESDFESILKIYNDILEAVLENSNEKVVQKRAKNINAINELRKKFIHVIKPYLQIEK